VPLRSGSYIKVLGTEIQDVNAVFCNDFLNSTEHFHHNMFRQQVIHQIKGVQDDAVILSRMDRTHIGDCKGGIRISLFGDSDHVLGQITAGTMKAHLEKHTQHIAPATGNIQDMLVFDAVFFHCVFNYANINVARRLPRGS